MALETKRPLKVFLCHASGDKLLVLEMYKRLVSEGVDAWLDREKLLPGQDWRSEIPRAVQESDVVVIFLSQKSITKEGYVQKEIKSALDIAEEKPEGTIFLIPARLEECPVPDRLSRWQWVDLYEENGFNRLLRSLKLRADRVGATIEPLGYESEDQETERRLDQLYTEGLAAFYTEDWNRASQRFQAILRERPNHKNAAEKLAQAELQRSLTKLYTQATEAYQSENWQVAITSLEDLLEKSGDYKDAVQLLKDVKKQRQLRELYLEAKRLHAAQKWQAVIKVLGQITAIESTYPDPDGLLFSAQKEADELKRLADLNDLYRQGVLKMDAGEWYEARSLLEQVHKTQTGFLDTERLLRKVEDEIVKIEELNKRNIHTNTLYDQAQGLVRSKNWRKALEKIEEIRKLDDQFVDKDGIFEKVKTELEHEEKEAQRQRELGALYAEAVSLLEARKYQEALEKWNAIQAIDPRYKDGMGVRKTAKRKLDELTQPEVTGQPWRKTISNWFSSEANTPSDRIVLTEKLLLISFVVVVIIHLLWDIVRIWLNILESVPIIRFLYWCLLGGLYGTVVAFTLNRIISNWHLKSSLTLVLGWALGFGVSLTPIVSWDFPPFGFSFYWYIAFSIVAAIKWGRPAFPPISLIIIFASWGLVWKAAGILAVHLQSIFNPIYTWAFVDGLTILLGLLFTFGTQIEDYKKVLEAAFFGTLGFAVGNYIAYITYTLLLLPDGMFFAVWGLIGGAILEAPSRDSRRILISATICGVGLFVGSYVAVDVLPNVRGQYANSIFLERYLTLRQPFLGIGLGLAFGLLIRRASAIGVLAVLGVGIYMITRALNADVLNIPPFWENIVRGALIGFVLGYGYGYMRKATPLPNALRLTRTKWAWVGIISLLVIAIPAVIWLSSPPPFTSYRWDFDYSAESWGYEYTNDISIPRVWDGSLKFNSTGAGPQILSPGSLNINASATPVITVRMRVIQEQDQEGLIYFVTNKDNNWDDTKVVPFFVGKGDGTFQVYNILMSTNPNWKDVILQFRLDPTHEPNAQIAIDYISVHAP